MKKRILILLCAILFIGAIPGCGGSKTQETDSGDSPPSVESTEPQVIDGENLATDKFTVTKINGWEHMDVPGGFQIYKNSGEILQMQFLGNNVSEGEDKALLEGLKAQYGGTDLKEVELFGLNFYMTSYTANAVDQAFYSTVLNGEQIKLQVTGTTYETDKDIKAMVESIEILAK